MKNYLLLLFLACTFIVKGQSDQYHLKPDFVHVVLFWLEEPDNAEQRSQFESNLKTLVENSKHTYTNYIGTPPVATRDVVDDSFDYMLIVSFPSAAEQEAYQDEEAHLQFIDTTAELWSKVLVYDAMGRPVRKM